ncbi:site-specific tyrosine recombinase XerC [Paraburkholderia domus]|uniref:site-specific tyrosine recombinase XerC n=1 Tax=Paraburkholderia domus TaxID=2793075 RepID=UPI0019141C57|nr:site-specific tyrosine recombinase XerC [Paraburkholderia domus]MBK5179379.1 site-specific tyrosine recombinase XerC [Burkholderia sp. R-69749]MBK5179385.1 site-specific tyrosine recombinase XerC [Burkholderia sp. R-69749]CAE6789149.1 Tyrosine recombinase XerD [Paraburkholderia domus]CAE6789285.1 Tyrosine recombinase XerD [Paraburkholderia domus]
MHKMTSRAPLPVIGPAGDAQSLYYRMLPFLEWMRVQNYSEETVTLWEKYLRYFIQWCDERSVTQPAEVTRALLERYQRHMYLYRKRDGGPLTARSQGMRIVPVRAWFSWMVKRHWLLSNVAADLELPRKEQRLPKYILSAQESERVINMADVSHARGIRDRAMLETLYSTGMRRFELAGLHVHDIDHEGGTVTIRQGKGKKDRVVPIGERALSWLVKYRDEARPEWVRLDDDGTLFLTHRGHGFSKDSLGHLVRRYIESAGIGKRGSCHLFRHTMATLMIENGADVSFVQSMLGHADLKSTQVYTHIAIRKLKEVHAATHPARSTRLKK